MACQQGDPSKAQIGNPNPPIYGTFPYPIPPPPAQQQQYHPPPPIASSQPCDAQPQYHAVPAGYQYYAGPAVVAEGLPVRLVRVREPPLPCCGIGIGWALFVAGFFFASIPWYVGVFILLFVGVDYREKAGLVACTVAAVLAAIAAILGISGNNLFW